MTFDYNPHPRTERELLAGPPKVKDAPAAMKGNGRITNFNRKLGLGITLVVGTMWTAYIFALLAFISAPFAFKTHDPIVIVSWITQTFLQLVLLPIIIVGQNIQAKAADMRAESTYKDAEAVLHEAQEIQKHLEAQDKHLERQDEIIAKIIQHLEGK